MLIFFLKNKKYIILIYFQVKIILKNNHAILNTTIHRTTNNK